MQEFILAHGSYLAIIIVLILTGAGLPVPEEVVTVAAGVLSSSAVGKLNPELAFLSCLVGALLGDCVVFGIGRLLGTNFIRQHPRFARFMNEKREKQMEMLIQKHGLKVFFVARFLVGIRLPIYFAAGAMRIDFRKFLLMDAVCATTVVGTFFWMSHHFGGWVGPLLRDSELAVTIIVLLVAALGAAYYVAGKKLGGRLQADELAPKNDEHQSV